MDIPPLPLTDPTALAALYDTIGDHGLVDTVVRSYPNWSSLVCAPRPDLAWRVGPWAAALRLPASPPPPRPLGHGVSARSRYRPDYPARLTDLPDAPVVVYTRGVLPERPMLAVGGSHYPGEEGRAASAAAGRAAATLGVPIVAALDSGCGHVALEAATAEGGVCVAVASADISALGVNQALVERIITLGGAVISEWGPRVEWCETRVFHAARLVAALGSAVVLAELGVHPSAGAHLARAAIAASRYLIVPRPDDADLSPVSSLATPVLAYGRCFSEAPFGSSPRLARRASEGRSPADAVVSDTAQLGGLIASLCRPATPLAVHAGVR